VGSSGNGATPTGTTPSTTTTPTATTETEATTAPRGATVAFGDLSDEEQSAFLDAIEDEATFGPCGDRHDRSATDVFRNHDYVRYEGGYYGIEITNAYGRLWQSRTYEMRPAVPGESDDVVAFDELPPSDQNAVRAAIDGTYRSPFCGHAPAVFSDGDYVRYRNETYRPVDAGIIDVAEWTMTVSEYDG
jgi:hypothetical protein